MQSQHNVGITRVWFADDSHDGASELFVETPDRLGILFALTIGLTVLFIIFAGCTVGSMLPIALKRIGIDPATSSTPFIASLVDTMGVIIYAHVAMVVMRDVIQAHLAAPPP